MENLFPREKPENIRGLKKLKENMVKRESRLRKLGNSKPTAAKNSKSLNNPAEWNDFHETSIPINVTNSLFEGAWQCKRDDETECLNSKKLSKLLELSPAMVIITDRWGEFEYANPTFLTTVGYTLSEVEGRGPGFLSSDIASSDKFYELQEAIAKGNPWKGELIKRKKNGEMFIFSATLSPIENSTGFISNYIIVGQDVTPFRETQDKLKKALEEKNVLLSELHHRVKNNLAVVSGMMQLQAFNETDEEVQDKLFSSAGRIKAMSSMHELLYESESLNRIRFDKVVEKVVHYVSGVYKKKINISLKWNLEFIELNINQAHPCTLIMFEVVSNAYKHAFENYESGEIDIKVYSRGENICFSVKDNGIGMAKEYHELGKQNSTTGYQLLSSLLKQIEGDFKYESDKTGTSFFVTFKKEDKKGISNANLPH
ncbi:sensor histidine kinase [Gracilimonas sp. Q87]|uniref:sensor histidine kinase n=1 Tax=Gracilimonas sp. Q87 TaxID=3384766 RepID=UPI0039845342